ncbi:hypothetical protein GCK32_022652 [Trichostrongylus colubriformis]|uniref:Uncharacterized protein n=1 Tax=Trichostrongylus colubriformis TaxID=6319 RepID=A0AAN8IQ56_TRICO
MFSRSQNLFGAPRPIFQSSHYKEFK